MSSSSPFGPMAHTAPTRELSRAVAPSRRQLLRTTFGAGLGLSVGPLLAACGGEQTSSSTEGGGWTFTDDRGQEISLDKRPTRIAGLTDVMAALWNYGITPTATFGQISIRDDVQFRGKDLDQVVEVGSTYGEIDLERLSAERPQLIVTTVYSDKPGKLLYGFKDKAQLGKAKQIAPVAVIEMVGVAGQVMKRIAKLADALAGNPSGKPVRRAKQNLSASAGRFERVKKRGVKALCLAGYDNEVHLAKPPDDPYLAYYQQLGMNFVEPKGKEFFWETLSWEQINNYPADVILYSLRAGDVAKLKKIPTFAALPAVRAGQVHPWKYTSPDYINQAKYVAELADWMDAAKKVI